MFNDNYYNGDPFALGLAGTPKENWPEITLKILSYSELLDKCLPDYAKQKIERAKVVDTIDEVSVAVISEHTVIVASK